MKSIFIFCVFIFSLAAHADMTPEKVASIRNCNPTQKSSLLQMDDLVDQRLQLLLQTWDQFDLAHVKASYVIPQNRKYTEGAVINDQYQAYWAQMRSNFAKMNANSVEGINFECHDNQADSNCQQGQVYAYVRFNGNQAYPMIYICSSFFTLAQDMQTSTVFHELSHYSAGTEDYAMDWWTPHSIDLLRASMDAYHVQNFMSGDPAITLQRSIWAWVWPKLQP